MIPSTLLAGWLSDKLFKGRRMPLAIICMTLIFICLIGYWKSESLLMVTVFFHGLDRGQKLRDINKAAHNRREYRDHQ